MRPNRELRPPPHEDGRDEEPDHEGDELLEIPRLPIGGEHELLIEAAKGSNYLLRLKSFVDYDFAHHLALVKDS